MEIRNVDANNVDPTPEPEPAEAESRFYENSNGTYEQVLVFEGQPGTELSIGADSPHKHASDLIRDRVIVVTDKDTYGFGQGVVIKKSSGQARKLPNVSDLSLTVKMGRPVSVPGLATLAGDVRQVLVRDPTIFRGAPEGQPVIDRPSPFVNLEADLANARGSARP